MKRTMYRLRFRDGSHGAWSSDYNRIKDNADFFNAQIETKEFDAPAAHLLDKLNK